MIPIAAILGLVTDDVLLRVGPVSGSLIYMTFSNVVQLITSIILLKAQPIVLLEQSLMGGLLAGLSLMPGLSFVAGGYNRLEQHFNLTVVQTLAALLALAVTSLTIPTVSDVLGGASTESVVHQSRRTSVILLFVYGSFLFFALKTHAKIFEQKSRKSPKRMRYSVSRAQVKKALALGGLVGLAVGKSKASSTNCSEPSGSWRGRPGAAYAKFAHYRRARPRSRGADYLFGKASASPVLRLEVALLVLIVGTTILGFNTSFALDSIAGLSEAKLPETFVVLILLPLLNNDVMCVQYAAKDKMDLALQTSIGKCLQTALLIIPTLVIIAWGMGIEAMTLSFDVFQIVVLFTSVTLLYLLSMGGKVYMVSMLLSFLDQGD